jgi:hypothetical protein
LKKQAELSTISAEHGFDYGPEFETALCRILRLMLPDRFGVCRGFLVNQLGDMAGDDIIIYESARFPTIGLRNKDDFSRKEQIPIEAAYAYIEAKHTLNIHGSDPQSLGKACEQVSAAKTLVSQRPSVDYKKLGPYMKLPPQMNLTSPDHYPEIQNPFFTLVISRNVRPTANTEYLNDGKEIVGHLSKEKITTTERPDLIVLGNHVIILPVIPFDTTNVGYVSSFFIKGKSDYHVVDASGIAYGVAVLSILSALDWINLGVLPWKETIGNALGVI